MLKVLAEQTKGYRRDSALTPIFMILEVVLETMIPLLMGSIIDNGVEKGDMNHIIKMGIYMVIAAGLGLFTGLMGAKYGARASTGLAKNLRKTMFEKIQTYSFSNIDKYSTAGLVTRLTTDVTNVQNAYQMLLRMFVRAPATLVFAMTMAFRISSKLSMVYLGAVFFLTIVLTIGIPLVSKYFTKVFKKYDALNASVQENISGIRVVKAFVREDFEKTKFGKASQNIYNLFLKAENITILMSPVMMITIYTCILLISWLGAKVIVQNVMSTGDLMALLTYCLNILSSLMIVSFMFIMLTMSSAAAKRIVEVITEEPTVKNPENPICEVKDGSVEFKNVFFKYNQGDEGENVLSDVSLSIKSGETIGIIGGTGSAKSTLVSLISRLYDATDGEVLVGGINVKDYDLEELRNKVAVVLQKNVLFSGSILENLRWGNLNATEEQCREACELACADEFIEKLPEKYETHIEQGGTNVSGGQRQRLCIARALLKNPKILILDDSTSAVDTATDAKIRQAFKDKIPDTTKIIIAQRISSVQHADKIIVLDEGKVNGFGSHDELVKTNNIYREVYESQTNGNGDFDENGGED
ncbi:MAG: ABC transporter ATP-binding protein/permease [Clostridia bacterium]|nr:ABC transporter ATP-binding protein/permease [Clostridia bacterium]